MGTVVSLEVRDPDVPADAIEAVFRHLHDIDARFSPYKSDSEMSRIGRHELAEADASPDLRWVLGACDDLCRTSGGYFDARRWRADGRVDPSGFVKGWAVEEASLALDAAGARNWYLNAGGDVIVRGEAAPGRPWRVGIRHPRAVDRVAAVLGVRDCAVATSGGYERGGHIVDPHTGSLPGELLAVTVVGPSLTWADAYATIAFVRGREGLTWVTTHPGYDTYGITADEQVLWSAGMEPLLVR